MTKDELIAQKAILEEKIEQRIKKDTDIREKLSKILNFPVTSTLYGTDVLEVRSWYEIFSKIGELIVARNFYDFEGNVSEIECKTEDLNKMVHDLIDINKK